MFKNVLIFCVALMLVGCGTSYSGNGGGNCVEVARNLPGLVAVRDSKEPDGAKLVVSQASWRVFLKVVRA